MLMLTTNTIIHITFTNYNYFNSTILVINM